MRKENSGNPSCTSGTDIIHDDVVFFNAAKKDTNRLHKAFVEQKGAVDIQLKNFEALFHSNQKASDQKIEEHEKRMAAIQNSFREEMALCAPVEYR